MWRQLSDGSYGYGLEKDGRKNADKRGTVLWGKFQRWQGR